MIATAVLNVFNIAITNPHQTFVKLFENWEQSETDKLHFPHLILKLVQIIWFVQRDQRGFLTHFVNVFTYRCWSWWWWPSRESEIVEIVEILKRVIFIFFPHSSGRDSVKHDCFPYDPPKDGHKIEKGFLRKQKIAPSLLRKCAPAEVCRTWCQAHPSPRRSPTRQRSTSPCSPSCSAAEALCENHCEHFQSKLSGSWKSKKEYLPILGLWE